jgi:hypothetical protein
MVVIKKKLSTIKTNKTPSHKNDGFLHSEQISEHNLIQTQKKIVLKLEHAPNRQLTRGPHSH